MLNELSPEDRKRAYDYYIGLTGSNPIENLEPDQDWLNRRLGPGYSVKAAEHIAKRADLTEEQIEHLKRHADDSDVALNLFHNENLDPKHAVEMWHKWNNNEDHHGYHKDQLTDHIKEKARESMYDGDYQNLHDEAEQEAMDEYPINEYMRNNNLKRYDDDDLSTHLHEKYDWKHDNPDFDEDEEESEENPRKIDYSSHDIYGIEDHPDHDERVSDSEDYLDDHMEVPDKVYDAYHEDMSESISDRFYRKFEDHIEDHGMHDYNHLPEHIRGKIEDINDKHLGAEVLKEKKLKEFHDKYLPTERPKTHEYGAGQHHLEMMKDVADANNGNIDLGRMVKLYPAQKEEWKKHFGGHGKVTSQEIQHKIDTLPKTKYNVSYGKWEPHGAQNVNGRDQVVVRLDHTPDSYGKIKGKSEQHAKLFDLIHKAAQTGSHPSNADSIGWARLDLNEPKHAMLDEMQSDFGKSARLQLERGGYTDHANVVADIEKDLKGWREAHLNFLTKLLKTNGYNKMSTHSPESKAKVTGADTVHSVYKESYKQFPRAIGFKPVPSTDLPLTDQGKKEFIKETDLDDLSKPHRDAHHHHIAMMMQHVVQKIQHNDESHPDSVIHQKLSKEHAAMAEKHKQKVNLIHGEPQMLSVDAGIARSNWPETYNHVRTGVETQSVVPHAADAKLDSPILKPKVEDLGGHQLDLQPNYAEAIAKADLWDIEFDDLMKIEIMDEEEYYELKKSELHPDDKKILESHQDFIDLYHSGEQKDSVYPSDRFSGSKNVEVFRNQNLSPEYLHKLIDISTKPHNQAIRDFGPARHILYHKAADQSHVDKIINSMDSLGGRGSLAAELLHSFAEDVGRNSFDKKITLSPDQLGTIGKNLPDFYLEDFLYNHKDNVSDEFINHLAREREFDGAKSSKKVLRAVKDRLKPEHISKLWDKHKDILAGSPNLPDDLLNQVVDNHQEALGNSEKSTYEDFINNPKLNHEHLERIIKPAMGKDAVMTQNTLNSRMEDKIPPHANQSVMARNSIDLMRDALHHPNFNKERLAQIVSDPANGHIAREAMRSNKSIDPKVAKAAIRTWAGHDGDINHYSKSNMMSRTIIGSALRNTKLDKDDFEEIQRLTAGKPHTLPHDYYEHKQVPVSQIESLINSPNKEDIDTNNHLTHAIYHPDLDETHFDKLVAHPNRYVALAAKEAAQGRGMYEDPDKVNVSFGTTKLREARDMARTSKDGKAHKKDFEKAGLDPAALKISHLQDAKGYIHHDAISSAIDAAPKMKYGYSYDKYGNDYNENIEKLKKIHMMSFKPTDYGLSDGVTELKPHDEEEYNNAVSAHMEKFPEEFKEDIQGYHNKAVQKQQHSLEESKVFQLNLTRDHFKKMKEAGVDNIFKDMHGASYSSGHPGAAHNGVGWLRYTEKPDGLFVDEIQSDFGQSFAKQAHGQLDAKVARGEMSPEDAEEHKKQFAKRWPEDSYKKIKDIIFGDKHSNEVIHEAFKQHLRDKGEVGKNIHMWHEDGKAPISNMSDSRENPVHMKITYNQNPKKMGYKPANYGEISTQSNPDLKGEKTWQHTLKKAREVLNTLNKTLGNKK